MKKQLKIRFEVKKYLNTGEMLKIRGGDAEEYVPPGKGGG